MNSDILSVGTLLVSVLSAIYTWRTYVQAKRSNDLTLHRKKFQIYEEIVEFSDCFRGLFSVPTYERVEQFNKNTVLKSEIYLSDDSYQILKEIYTHCSESEVNNNRISEHEQQLTITL